MATIDVLKKVEYENLEQFQADLNANFAIIENSPLFKGIPGQEGLPGAEGLRGIRGIKFMFVDLAKFQSQFPNELILASNIDLNFLNSKVETFENKQKLLNALEVTEFVDKDIIVLSNSMMLAYKFNDEVFESTGVAFNPETNLMSNINTIIENYVTYYINNHPGLNSMESNLTLYQTYAKNYADNNSGFITTELLGSSVYSPYIPGFNNTTGIHIPNHKYYGYSDIAHGLTDNGTRVFGSMRRYYQLLMATISTAGTETLSSDYAPGVNNIPSAVFLQDTYNNGLYLGHKNKNNLRRFASIYKNESDELIIKSDSSPLASEYSMLKIHRQYMKYDKLVQFGDSLEVSRNLQVFSDINQKHIKTGKFTAGASAANNHNTHKVEFGASGLGTIALTVSEFAEYSSYLNRVMVTDSNGRVSKNYALETLAPNINDLLNLNQITNFPTNPNNILTSNYFAFLATKLNNISSFVTANYWRKNQFNNAEIPNLHLNNALRVANNFSVDDSFVVNRAASQTDIQTQRLNIHGNQIKYNNFINKVLVTDQQGLLMNSYEILTQNVGPLTQIDNPNFKVLTAKYWNVLAAYLNDLDVSISGEYWKKNQYLTHEIPGIHLQSMLNLGLQSSAITNVIFRNSNGIYFTVTKPSNGTTTMKMGAGTALFEIEANNIRLTHFPNRVLVTNSTGTLLNSYFIHNLLWTTSFQPMSSFGGGYINPAISEPIQQSFNTSTSGTSTNGIPTYQNIRQIWNYFISFRNWIMSTFWRKDQYNTAEIPALHVSNTLKANGDFIFGAQTNPTLDSTSSGLTLNVGKNAGTTNFRFGTMKFLGRFNKVIATDATGAVVDTSLTSLEPTSSNPQGLFGNVDTRVEENFWKKNPTPNLPQNFLDVEDATNKIPTTSLFRWVVANFKAIRKLMYDRPTYQDMNLKIMPVGSIIMHSGLGINISDLNNNGWYVCNGATISYTDHNGTQINNFVLPNLLDSYPKFMSSVNTTPTGAHAKHIGSDQIPKHDHYIANKFSNNTGDYNANNVTDGIAVSATEGTLAISSIGGAGASNDRYRLGVLKGNYAYHKANYFKTSVYPPLIQTQFNVEPRHCQLVPIIRLH